MAVAAAGDIVAQRMVDPSCEIKWSSTIGAALGGIVSESLGNIAGAAIKSADCGALGAAIVHANTDLLDWTLSAGITVGARTLFSSQQPNNAAAAWTFVPQTLNRYPTIKSQGGRRSVRRRVRRTVRRARHSSSCTAYNACLA